MMLRIEAASIILCALIVLYLPGCLVRLNDVQPDAYRAALECPLYDCGEE